MAFMECHFHSDILGMASSMNVIMPETSTSQIGVDAGAGRDEFPCLYLLHGLTDDHSIWMRRTSIERDVAGLGLAVVMPNVHRSFYTNMAAGYRYWDFVTEEVPSVVESMFRVSGKRGDRFVAGLSMGGYGAFKIALHRGDMFAAAASLSGALDMVHRAEQDEDSGFGVERRWVFGDPSGLKGSKHDLLAVAGRAAEDKRPLPFMYQWCGTEDFLYEDNRRFTSRCREAGLDVITEEGPGDHRWECWDRQIVRFLDLLLEKGLLTRPTPASG